MLLADVAHYLDPTKSSIAATIWIVVGVSIFLFILFLFIRRVNPMKKTPLWLIPFMWLVDMMNGYIKVNIGKRWKAYSPWFLTLIIFIFFANISSVYLFTNPTGYVVVTFALAMCTFFVIQASGIVSNGFLGYLKGFLDPTPVMLPMNILSEFTLPISLLAPDMMLPSKGETIKVKLTGTVDKSINLFWGLRYVDNNDIWNVIGEDWHNVKTSGKTGNIISDVFEITLKENASTSNKDKIVFNLCYNPDTYDEVITISDFKFEILK